ncbi:methylase [Parenemella sanctibonifatiensis]|uniref:site-specific DNA-methyltransferase (adenine-specific) n=1 Tax=Parenemella sanctibonifatiensis TaxID=2016505 RepID=A0A255EFC5_9ACTN|nr:methylase [Parenemella sanctibonifatiensis]
MRSRDRVKAYGEVFTPAYMVDQMLDLVREDLEVGPDFVDRTFLEPAAGNGNFLVAILRRKLAAIEKEIPPELWRQESLFALASIYGIELLPDNHAEARAAMLATFANFHGNHGVAPESDALLHRAAAFLIDTNVIRGNTLTGMTTEGIEIEFSWWHRVPDRAGAVQREPFSFTSLRGDAFDFNLYTAYQVCPIDRVHEEVGADV